MNLHATDGNMKALADYLANDCWHPSDFDACCKCGCDFYDDADEHEPQHMQSKDEPALCQYCADTVGDEE